MPIIPPTQAQYIQQRPYGPAAGNLLVYIPSIMPTWGPGDPKVVPCSLNKSCYNNANECKPTVADKISTQNYATAHKKWDYDFSCYAFGSTIYVDDTTENGDFLTMSLNKWAEDNSFDP